MKAPSACFPCAPSSSLEVGGASNVVCDAFNLGPRREERMCTNIPGVEAGSEDRGGHQRACGGIQLSCFMRAQRCMISRLQTAPDPVCMAYLVFFKSLESVANIQTSGYFTQTIWALVHREGTFVWSNSWPDVGSGSPSRCMICRLPRPQTAWAALRFAFPAGPYRPESRIRNSSH